MGKITEEMPMNITVYLGANEGSDPALKQAVEELGRWIGESGNALVYGCLLYTTPSPRDRQKSRMTAWA